MTIVLLISTIYELFNVQSNDGTKIDSNNFYTTVTSLYPLIFVPFLAFNLALEAVIGNRNVNLVHPVMHSFLSIN